MEKKLAKLKDLDFSFIVESTGYGNFLAESSQKIFSPEDLVFPQKNDSNLWLFQCAALQGLMSNPLIVNSLEKLEGSEGEKFMNRIADAVERMALLAYHNEFRCGHQ